MVGDGCVPQSFVLKDAAVSRHYTLSLHDALPILPQTKKLLTDVTETTQQFQIRRCCTIINQMLREREPVSLWKVQRIGAVKSHHFYEIKPYLEAYINMKQEVDNYELTTS